MRVEQFSQIIEVSKTQSINRAAQNCFISHQNLCNTINNVEKEFEIQIFQRSTRGVSLTKTGEKFIELAQEVLDTVNQMADLKQTTASEQNNYFIKYYHVPNLSTMTQLSFITQLCRTCSNIKVAVTQQNSDELAKSVAHTQDAVGFLVLPKKGVMKGFSDNHDIKLRYLYKEKLQICVGPSYPLDHKTVTITKMLKHPWVIFEYGDSLTTETWLEPFGKPNVFMRTNSPEMFRRLIRENMAIGMVVESISNNKQFVDDGIRFIPLRESTEALGFYFHVLYSARHPLSPGAELFVDALTNGAPVPLIAKGFTRGGQIISNTFF